MGKKVIARQTIVPLRKEDDDASEMVSQLLFGEIAEILEEKAHNWMLIRAERDGYEGWVDPKMMAAWSGTEAIQGWKWVNELSLDCRDRYGGKGQHLRLTAGCRIPITEQTESQIISQVGGRRISIPVEGLSSDTNFDRTTVVELSSLFLGAPYLWGGKTVWGVDCSGLVQTVFAIAGKQMLRDASQQITAGKTVSFGESGPGDLAFFVNENGKIHHVGILLGDGEIRHAHGWVHDDLFTEEGIRNRLSDKLTHKLHTIKTFY